MLYPVVFSGLNKFQAALTDYALKYDRVNTSYHLAKNFLTKVLERAKNNPEYQKQVNDWLIGRTSTIELREILKVVGCDYWRNLDHSGACDYIDSVSCYFKK